MTMGDRVAVLRDGVLAKRVAGVHGELLYPEGPGETVRSEKFIGSARRMKPL